MNCAFAVIAVVAACAAPAFPPVAQGQEEPPSRQPPVRQVAPDQPPEFGDPRFAFHRAGDGYLRLDMRNGEVAVCSQRASGWACTLAPDERMALDNEIARLQRDNAALKNALLERGAPLPNGMYPDAVPTPAPSGPPVASLPPPPRPPGAVPPALSAPPKAGDHASRDADIDRVMNVIEKVWRRLVEMMGDLQRDIQKKS